MKKITETMGKLILILGSIGATIASFASGSIGGAGAFIAVLLSSGFGVAVSASVFFALNEILENQENINNMVQQLNTDMNAKSEKQVVLKKPSAKEIEPEEITTTITLSTNNLSELLNVIDRFDSAKEIYEYLLTATPNNKFLSEKIIPSIEKIVQFEKLYGNSKADAIQTIKQLSQNPSQ